ncbi:zinc finger SWIM domain-containing protein 7 isoform X1 [Rhinopithecus roxellana]|uniref:zinc finger SWIM domain-containing protein 7 isoform X1 n=1 Tax=Rhinopithecus roxellana TaxID=61622 RepID=UPI0012377CC5|nr:zinc finger SWIM domain-containing protein 7 isoform X1 [Rhinopithecus roxellana]XP_030779153.1 zinc finger SWIM domain-containing protein 7 isoform X1 [Rhinopithecus roxellana]XP_030779154.1 zinc finger SWIM domain-containing protein 7 isoform X1 [Rhinopithecus roxellana]
MKCAISFTFLKTSLEPSDLLNMDWLISWLFPEISLHHYYLGILCIYVGCYVPDEYLLSLKFLFGSSATQALDLVDRQSITLISSPSGRHAYQVLGSSGKTYTCLASCHYCSCPAFAFSVLRKSDSILCKHLLAVYLSQVMRTCQQLSVSDKQLTDILLMEKKQEA